MMSSLEADFEREVMPTIDINLLGSLTRRAARRAFAFGWFLIVFTGTMRVNHVFAEHILDSNGASASCSFAP